MSRICKYAGLTHCSWRFQRFRVSKFSVRDSSRCQAPPNSTTTRYLISGKPVPPIAGRVLIMSLLALWSLIGGVQWLVVLLLKLFTHVQCKLFVCSMCINLTMGVHKLCIRRRVFDIMTMYAWAVKALQEYILVLTTEVLQQCLHLSDGHST